MKQLPAIIVFLFFLAIPQQAPAATPKISPGLWEHTFTMKTRSGLLEGVMGQLASLAPEHMQMVEQVMTNQGVNFGPSGNLVQVCITREDAARGEVPQIDSNCKQKMVHSSASTIKVSFSCDSDPPTRGEGEITFLNPQSYTGKAVVVTTVQGISEQMNVEQKGRWLSADCGKVAPLGR